MHLYIIGTKAIFCGICEKWVNGPSKWHDHEKGEKHLKKLKRCSKCDLAK